MVRASALQLVDLGFIPHVESYQKTSKMVSTASLFGDRHIEEVVENTPASSLVVSLGKALCGWFPSLSGRQVTQTLQKWQLPGECGRPVQNKVIQFAFS